jgi:hypothetical protein
MNTCHRRSILCASFAALLLTAPGFAQAPAQPPAAAPVEFPKAQLETEQRVMKANIADANYHIDRGIKAVSANLPELAKVSVLRATGRVAQVDEVMKSHPERIERVAMVLFTSREEVRKPLRVAFEKIRDEFGALELAMYAFRKDMLRKGIFGEELKQQIAVLDAATKLLPEIEKKDPALAEKIRSKIEEINKALAAGDSATADRLIKELNGMLEGAGYKQAIQNAKDELNKAGGGTSPAGGGGATVTGAGGQTATIPGATATSGGKIRLADGTEIDPTGCTVLPDGSIRLADGRIVKDGRLMAAAGPAGPVTPTKDGRLVDADGNEISDEYVWENGEGKGIDKTYVGGKGARLTRETKVSVRATPSSTKANTYEVTKTPGEARSWAFVVAPVPGSEKKSSGSLTLTLALSDRNGATGFTVSKWEITSPSGAPSQSGSTGAQVTATFTASATYTIQVTGTTDWGSAFVIKSTLPVGVD